MVDWSTRYQDITQYHTKGGIVHFDMQVFKIPVFRIENDRVYLNFDLRYENQFFKELRYLLKNNVDLFLVSRNHFIPRKRNPDHWISNSNGVDEDIRNFLHNYAQSSVNKKFKKYDIDAIELLIKYVDSENAFETLSEEYTKINKRIQTEQYDWFQSRKYFDHDRSVREEYDGLLRRIKLKRILL